MCQRDWRHVLSLSTSSAKIGKPKEEIQKYFGRKKRLESLAQVYIDDIHVIDVFLWWSHKVILGYLYLIGWYEVSYNATQYKNTMA